MQFLAYKEKYEAEKKQAPAPLTRTTSCKTSCCDFLQRLTRSLALSSTDTWMESMIKKKQQKKGKSTMLDPHLVAGHIDPLEELQRYLLQPRLRREDCPNPIPWWGVSNCVFACFVGLMLSVSINWNTQSFG
jgi:hypothetical protein